MMFVTLASGPAASDYFDTSAAKRDLGYRRSLLIGQYCGNIKSR